jgi:hypothetical protein
VLYFLINCIVCLFVIVWSVVNDEFVEYVAVEDQEGFEQYTLGLKTSPCCIRSCPVTTCILITQLFTFCLH